MWWVTICLMRISFLPNSLCLTKSNHLFIFVRFLKNNKYDSRFLDIMRSAVMGTYMLVFEFLVPHIDIFLILQVCLKKFQRFLLVSIRYAYVSSIWYIYIYFSLCLHCESVTFNVKSDNVYEHKWTSLMRFELIYYC